jgi:hypothetical protein
MADIKLLCQELLRKRDAQWIRDYRPWYLPKVGDRWAGETVLQVHTPVMVTLASGRHHLRVHLLRSALLIRQDLDLWSDNIDHLVPDLLERLVFDPPSESILDSFLEDFLDMDVQPEPVSLCVEPVKRLQTGKRRKIKRTAKFVRTIINTEPMPMCDLHALQPLITCKPAPSSYRPEKRHRKSV